MLPITIATIRKFNKNLDYTLLDNELRLFIELLEDEFPNVINYPKTKQGIDYKFNEFTKLMYYMNYAMPDKPQGAFSPAQKSYEIKFLNLTSVLKYKDKKIHKRMITCMNLYNHLREHRSSLQEFYEYKKGIMSEYVTGGVIPVPKSYEVWCESQ